MRASTAAERAQGPAPHARAVPVPASAPVLLPSPPPADPASHAPAPPGVAAAVTAAQEALASPWYLAVLAGPDAGLVVPLPRSGAVGRGAVLTDPAVSRRHLEVRCSTSGVWLGDAGSTNGTRVRRGPLWTRLRRAPAPMRAGTRLRAGETVLELRRRPRDLTMPAPLPARRAGLVTALGAAAVLALVLATAWTVRHGGRGPAGLAMLAPMLLLTAARYVGSRSGAEPVRGGAGWRGPLRREPDPSGLLLAAAARGAGRAGPQGHRSRTRADGAAAAGAPRAWAGRRCRGTALGVEDGDCVCLVGPSANRSVQWWAAQVVARGAARAGLEGGTVLLRWGGTGPEDGGAAEVVAAPGSQPPARAVTVRSGPRRAPALAGRWFDAVAAASGCGTASRSAEAGPPRCITLEEVIGDVDRDSVAARWSRADRGRLPAVLGVGAEGPLTVALVEDGPHALLSGATGSGKSEALLSWLLQLAVSCPPAELSLLLVDFKGGAAFGPLSRLPHTAGVLTDLEPALTRRALASLEAELRRRERLVRSHSAKDLAGLPARERPPRLVIAVDEFAVLAAEHPEVLDALVRVAAQGRSLGLHLILATQRPAGCISPSIRANTALRVCLRVLDAADSRDVLGHDGAAHLPAVPGRLLVAGHDAPVQAPWCGTSPHLERLVDEVRLAAAALGSALWRPWAEPLPETESRGEARHLLGVVATADPPVPGGDGHDDDGTRVLLTVLDLPEEQRLGPGWWDPGDPLLVLGGPGSGRSTAVLSAASAALDHGMAVHLCTSEALPTALRDGAPGVGTVLRPGDGRRTARLLALAAEGALRDQLLVVDDLEPVLQAVDALLGPGEGQALLETVVRAAHTGALGLVVAGPVSAGAARWCSSFRRRLVLGAPTAAQAAAAGLPRGVTTDARPGHGVLLEGTAATDCLVLLPGSEEHGRGPAARPRLLELPVAAPAAPGVWAVGGDSAGPLPAPRRSVLVTGPPGSGRSTALRALAAVLPEGESPSDTDQVLVADNLDLETTERQAEVEAALRSGARVLASTTTEHAASAYRGVIAALRERSDLVILDAGCGPAEQLAGLRLRGLTTPAERGLPGRGVLVTAGGAVPVQVARPHDRAPELGT